LDLPSDLGLDETRNDSNQTWAMVKFSYETDDPEELALQPDEVIEILEQNDDGWWKGALSSSLTSLLSYSNKPRTKHNWKGGNIPTQFCFSNRRSLRCT
jgi:SH3 domain